jgi:hypothetical protein
MRFLDKLFGRKKRDEQAETDSTARPKPSSTQKRGKRTTPSREEISQVYVYVAATAPVNAQTADQIVAYALDLLKADATFRQIMTKVEQDKIPIVKGHGTALSSGQFVDSFTKWLKTKGTSLDQAITVMGKKCFVQGGDAQNPADGSKFSWAVQGCFQGE